MHSKKNHESFEMGRKHTEKMRQKRAKGGERGSSDVQRGGRLVNDGGDSGKGVKKRAMSSSVGRTEKDKKRRRRKKEINEGKDQLIILQFHPGREEN